MCQIARFSANRRVIVFAFPIRKLPFRGALLLQTLARCTAELLAGPVYACSPCFRTPSGRPTILAREALLSRANDAKHHCHYSTDRGAKRLAS